jgi:agmatine deiminase
MPAEWEPHERCLMGWPDENCQWGPPLSDLRQSYADVAHAIRQFEPVTMVVSPDDLKSARNYLGSDIEILPLKVENPWLRDIAPTFVLQPDGTKAGVCWRFNGYTGLTEWESDKDLAERICTELSIPAILSPLAMEGGGLHVDGRGALLTTDSLVFETTRNQGLTRAAAEQELRRTLGVDRIIWLPGNSNEAGTSGHIDGQTCFVAPDRIVFEETSETDDELRSAVDANRMALQRAFPPGATTYFHLLHAQSPSLPVDTGWGFCASYVNFYLPNGGVVMPRFGQTKEDAAAFDVLKAAMTDREIVQVDVAAIGYGGGGIHCITQQVPLARA